MFKSKSRNLNITQYEHGRLAGELAHLWGNAHFDKPALDHTAFVQGVALHDWHYGLVDQLAIGEASEDDWLVMVRHGAVQDFANPVTDIVAKLHLKRLLQGRDSAEIKALISQIEAHIVTRLAQTEYSREQFEWADRITAFCDMVAFHFSFEAPSQHSQSVYAKHTTQTETTLTYSINPKGKGTIDPWPFSVPSFSGLITGFERQDYPEKLVPQTVPYHFSPLT